jgi:hypothetical protein
VLWIFEPEKTINVQNFNHLNFELFNGLVNMMLLYSFYTSISSYWGQRMLLFIKRPALFLQDKWAYYGIEENAYTEHIL